MLLTGITHNSFENKYVNSFPLKDDSISANQWCIENLTTISSGYTIDSNRFSNKTGDQARSMVYYDNVNGVWRELYCYNGIITSITSYDETFDVFDSGYWIDGGNWDDTDTWVD